MTDYSKEVGLEIGRTTSDKAVAMDSRMLIINGSPSVRRMMRR